MSGFGGPARRVALVAALFIGVMAPSVAVGAAPDDDVPTTTTAAPVPPAEETAGGETPPTTAPAATTAPTAEPELRTAVADEAAETEAVADEAVEAVEATEVSTMSVAAACGVASTIHAYTGHGGAVCLEQRLAELGYAINGPDEYFAGDSVTSLRAFQASYGIPGNGTATPLTLSYLGIWWGPSLWEPCAVASTVYAYYGHGGSVCVERRLAQLGYAVDGPDEYFAGSSVYSLQQFQAARGIPGEGNATPLTLYHLWIWGGPSLWDPCAVASTVYAYHGHGGSVCVEARLAQMGYIVEGPDEYFAGGSVYSLQQFQAAHGLPGQGTATPLTLAYLGIWGGPNLWAPCKINYAVYANSGSGGSACVEGRLAQLGYIIEGPDEYFAGGSVYSLQQFQAANGLPANGNAMPMTLWKLGIWDGPNPDPFPLPANSGSGRRIVYDRSQQRVWAVEADGTVVKTHLVSGRLREPYAGTYSVYSRSMYTYSTENPNVKWRYMVRFAYGPGGGRIGFHEIPNKNGVPMQSYSQLGQPLSGGCVRQTTEDAIWMWNWAGLGTKVVVL